VVAILFELLPGGIDAVVDVVVVYLLERADFAQTGALLAEIGVFEVVGQEVNQFAAYFGQPVFGE
jgi:limonene-1,2-epoxide hydrolase